MTFRSRRFASITSIEKTDEVKIEGATGKEVSSDISISSKLKKCSNKGEANAMCAQPAYERPMYYRRVYSVHR